MARSDSRKRMIDATASLLRRQGYHGTGLNQIVRESGAPKGSMYFHFPQGKEQLACEALRAAGEKTRGDIAAALDADDVSAIQAVLDVLADELVASDFAEGCPVATVALEASAQSEAIRETAQGIYRGWQSLIEHRLAARGVTGPAAEDLSAFVLSAIEGALLLAKVYRSRQPIDAVGRMLTALVPAQP